MSVTSRPLQFGAIAICVMLGSVSLNASAAVVAVSIPDSSGLDVVNPENAVWGWEFSPTVAISITSLGIFDHDGDGLTDIHTIAIWSVADGSILTQQLFAPGTGADLLDGFRYIDIAPVSLQGDEKYIIGVFYPSSASDALLVANFDSEFTSSPFINSLGGRRTNSGFAFPDVAPEEEAFGPNFRFTVVPIPAAAWLLFSGLSVLAGLARPHRS